MIETNDKYSWDSDKRALVIAMRGLDFVLLADFVFAYPDIVVRQDVRHDYGEDRFLVYSIVDGVHLCMCYTVRDDKIHLITIFQMHAKEWRKRHDND